MPRAYNNVVPFFHHPSPVLAKTNLFHDSFLVGMPQKEKPKSLDDIALLRKLADNSSNVRAKGLRTVERYVASSRDLSSTRALRLWKGIWFALWHTPKPVAQRDLSLELAGLVSKVQDKNLWVFVNSFWETMIREWETLDRHRINKFMMLVRFFLNALLSRISTDEWNAVAAAEFKQSLLEGPLHPSNPKVPQGLKLHILDVYADEFEKVSEKNGMPSEGILRLVWEPLTLQSELAEFKTIMHKMAKEVLCDERLVQWGVISPPPVQEEDVESDRSEWEGFD